MGTVHHIPDEEFELFYNHEIRWDVLFNRAVKSLKSDKKQKTFFGFEKKKEEKQKVFLG